MKNKTIEQLIEEFNSHEVIIQDKNPNLKTWHLSDYRYDIKISCDSFSKYNVTLKYYGRDTYQTAVVKFTAKNEVKVYNTLTYAIKKLGKEQRGDLTKAKLTLPQSIEVTITKHITDLTNTDSFKRGVKLCDYLNTAKFEFGEVTLAEHLRVEFNYYTDIIEWGEENHGVKGYFAINYKTAFREGYSSPYLHDLINRLLNDTRFKYDFKHYLHKWDLPTYHDTTRIPNLNNPEDPYRYYVKDRHTGELLLSTKDKDFAIQMGDFAPREFHSIQEWEAHYRRDWNELNSDEHKRGKLHKISDSNVPLRQLQALNKFLYKLYGEACVMEYEHYLKYAFLKDGILYFLY
jgi:hypothetical protein